MNACLGTVQNCQSIVCAVEEETCNFVQNKMMMIQPNELKVYFYAKKAPLKKDGKFPVMGRVVLNGKRKQFSTEINVKPEHTSKVNYYTPYGIEEIRQLIEIRNTINFIYHNMTWERKAVTTDILVDSWKLVKSDPEAIRQFIISTKKDPYYCRKG